MAQVMIYPEHRDVLDALISSGKVKSVMGATRTGPFSEQRDAYVFAASIGMAISGVEVHGEVPESKKGATSIRDSVFFGADGAEELSQMAVLLEEEGAALEQELKRQLTRLADDDLSERLELLDQYAYAGFEWLRDRWKDEATVRDLILTVLDEVECTADESTQHAHVEDPLLDVLLL